MKRTRFTALILVVVLLLTFCLAACGAPATPPAGGSTTTPPAGNTGNAPATPPAADKDEIVIGYVAPFTGPLACFTVAIEWVEAKCLDVINADGGIYIEAYDKKLPVRVVYGDSESDAATATEVATKMVLETGVDLLVAAWTPDTTNPVAAVAERYQIPALMSNSPADSWLTGGPYEWSYGVLFYWEEALADYIAALDKVDTNKKVGFVFDAEVDGVLLSGYLNEMLPAAGYTVVDPGRFPMSTTDYSSVISKLQSEDCDIVMANQITPNFTTFWQQCHQMGYIPKVCIIGKAEHFGTDVSALGAIGENLMSEVLWDRSFPYSSSLLDYTCETICEAWETENNSQFPATLGYDVSTFEILDIALRNCKDLEPATIRDAIAAVEYDGIYGHLSFNEDNVAAVPCPTIQWVAGETWEYEKNLVASVSFPDIKATADVAPIPGYTTGK
ncbi:MAG: ABC transporter substrate-binding protein [Oscillospiraceae bacterium]|nr:ABC transporter substrate-binding protein [Oscillospiraceae bacterium]